MPNVRIVGPGRAGMSLADALGAAGWTVGVPVGRTDDPRDAAKGVDVCVIATPDDAIAGVARAIEPVATTVVAHLSGSRELDVLVPHERRASLHPLASLPDRRTGSRTLASGIWFAVDGDPEIKRIVDDLGGRAMQPTDRVAYHAAACIAANHTVTLLAQVERVAAHAGVPADAFYDLALQALTNARAQGARQALTGPAARGDKATIAAHLGVLDADEAPLYEALASEARRLAR